jgi:hypothetical protein
MVLLKIFRFQILISSNSIFVITGIPRFIALRRFCVFYKLKICGNPASSKSVGAIFPTFCVSVSRFCNSHNFKLFHYYYYICYGDLWSVIFDITVVIVLGRHEQSPYKTANLIDKCCVCSDCSTDRPFPCLSPSSWASLFSETQYWN